MSTYTSERSDPKRLYHHRDFIPHGLLDARKDRHGVSEILRLEIDRLVTQMYIDVNAEKRRILAFTIEFDGRLIHLPGLHVSVTALTEPVDEAAA